MINPKIHENGSKSWYNSNGELHRDDGPAIEWYDGSNRWFINGKRHRNDGPAIEHGDGTKAWYINGLRHRDDGR